MIKAKPKLKLSMAHSPASSKKKSGLSTPFQLNLEALKFK